MADMGAPPSFDVGAMVSRNQHMASMGGGGPHSAGGVGGIGGDGSYTLDFSNVMTGPFAGNISDRATNIMASSNMIKMFTCGIVQIEPLSVLDQITGGKNMLAGTLLPSPAISVALPTPRDATVSPSKGGK